VSLSDSLDVGVEMAGGEAPSTIGDTVLQGSTKVDDGTALMNAVQNGMFPRGITIGVAQGSSVNAEGQITASYPALLNVNAVKKDSKVRILSHIPLLAQDNREASVSVVQNIPLLKSTIEGGSGTARDVIQNIDRVDVGIKLKLTPHINPAGEVRMVLNPSIEAIVDVGLTTTEFTPTIAKREISTTVTVPDGKTIVLSGLIREDQGRSVRKIPILGSIPFLGWLFRHTIDSKERTNLLVLVTPHIVTGEKAAEAVRQRWENATGVATSNVAGRAAASN
jgi:type II secretory pathway component GspD/PulD (secretin)